MSYKSLLFLPLDIENPPLDELDIMNDSDINQMPKDKYRNCSTIPLYVGQSINELLWTPLANNHYKKLKQYCEDVLFPTAGIGRVFIIVTPPGETNPLHIDVHDKHNIKNSLHHKLRYVMQGNVNDLHFSTSVGDVSPKEIDKPYLMDGFWPHHMTNTSGQTKFTFSLSHPFSGSLEDKKYIDLLNQGYDKYKDYYLDSENLKLPENWKSLLK